MEYTEDQLRGFKEEFAKRGQTRLLATVLIVVLACLLGVVASLNKSKDTDYMLIGMFTVLLAVAVLFLTRTSRCPACGKIVGKPMRARFCDQCGVPLR